MSISGVGVFYYSNLLCFSRLLREKREGVLLYCT